MLDFLMISTRPGKRGTVEIYPRFIIKKSTDLMIRGGDFYAFWLDGENRWTTDEQDVIDAIDGELDKFYEENKSRYEVPVRIMHMWDAETGMIDTWHRYCQKQLKDSFHMLDEKLVFSNSMATKKDYASKHLNYPLEQSDTPAYDKLMSTLYSHEERKKIEWAVGSIVNGDSKKIQKFLVLYGAAGTGKSTVLNIIQQLFDGYYSVFDAKSLGSSNSSFALEAFSSNPLVAIQHDGDLSHIEDNTRLNSLVSHEMMMVNEKFKSQYSTRFKSFLFMGTNKPVKITDAKSGLIRRLIDVKPSGETLPVSEYKTTVKQIGFELGGIAWHCKQVYESDPGAYDDYIPIAMMDASNDFYNFVMDSYSVFSHSEGVSLKAAWEMYKTYCEDAKVPYPMSQRMFKEELKNYFDECFDRKVLDDGTRIRNYYIGFKENKFKVEKFSEEKIDKTRLIEFKEQPSVFDADGANWPAQYASEKETPLKAWKDVDTTLSMVDTSKLHYVRVPENHIVIDFDIPDADGNKCFEKNLEAASKWPVTYAELSKSGAGIHLHYIYTGDVSKLSRVYADHIEIKVFNGNSSLRRKLTKCNDLPIATISSGLPIKEEKKSDGVKIRSQKKLFEMIERNLRKEIHPGTKPSCDFIYKIVEDAYNDGVNYKIPDEMKQRIFEFAKNSTHHGTDCLKLMKKLHFQSKEHEMKEQLQTNSYKIREFILKVLNGENEIVGTIDMSYPDGVRLAFDVINEALNNSYNSGIIYDVRDVKSQLFSFATSCHDGNTVNYCLMMMNKYMKFCSDLPEETIQKDEERAIIFYDIEVFPNLLLVNWKAEGEEKPMVRWINPTPEQIEELIQFRLIGFNCRRYDNHIIYARLMGYTIEQLYDLSQRIINGDKTAFFGEAYNLSYTDIYDFASAGNKKSLKKLEIEMGIHHQELGLPWDQPVPEEKWAMVAEYCDNDVIATEKTFNYLKADWTARCILSDIAGMSVNDTTNSLTTRIIFGKDRDTENELRWRDLSKPVKKMDDDMLRYLSERYPVMMSMTHGVAHSLLPYYPGYKKEAGVSTYRGEVVGEGGYVFAIPGMYSNVKTYDVGSQHPHSADAEYLFGKYTRRFGELMDARIYIKHEDWSKAEKVLDGKLKPYIQKVKNGEMTSKELADALKTAINSVYGLTAAAFKNPFRSMKNIDNIVAKRGALTMIDLKYTVQEMGGMVVHIKTDSIKIANPTPEIEKFIFEFGREHGYEFEIESEYEKMCLVNDAVYIAKYSKPHYSKEDKNKEHPIWWTATGTQFQVPYVFKTLFSKEPIEFDDMCETKSVTSSLYLDFNESMAEDEHNYHFVGRVGQFTPVIDGVGGGVLYREKDGKYYAATGTKGYRWMESEILRQFEDYDQMIDRSYYQSMVDEAVRTISQYGDFEWFAS